MADARPDAAATLNHLTETAVDGANGYRTAADGVQDGALRTLFTQYAAERDAYADELRQQVRSLGTNVQPEQGGTLKATAHRAWLDIKSIVTRRDDDAVLAECQRGDEYAVQQYEQAVLDGALPPSAVPVVQRQAAGVMRALAEVKRRQTK